MIYRINIQCETCKNNITLRISIGHELNQDHVISCPKCKENINIGLTMDPKTFSIRINKLENAKLTQENSNANIINVSPNFPIMKELCDKDYISSDMIEIMKLLKANSVLKDIQEQFPNGVAVDMTLLAGRKDDILSRWKKVKTCWSLYNNNQKELLEKHIPNKGEYKNFLTKKKDFKFFLFYFVSNFCNKENFESILQYAKKTRKMFPEEYSKFLQYISDNFFEKSMEKFYGLFFKFFDNYSEFGQLEIPALNNLKIDDTYNVTSFDFYKTDMFYGTAYELFTEFIDVLALMFNVHEGRNFNSFLNMNYTKYKYLDKANKSNPLKGVPELFSICKVLYSGLRNASHHGDITFDSTTHYVNFVYGKEKRHKGTMTYSEYLRNCYDIFISCCILINIIIILKLNYEEIEKTNFKE